MIPASAWRAALLALALAAVAERASAACGFDVIADFGQHDATFQQCLDTTCCSQSKTCYGDPLCRSAFTCLETKCAPNDVACENACYQQYPANQSELGALWSCTMKCPSSGSSGGAAGHAGTGTGASGGSGATSSSGGFGATSSSGGSGATPGGFGATSSSGGKPTYGSGGSPPSPFGTSPSGTSSDGEGAGGAADPQTVAFCATKGPGEARGGGLAWTAIALAIVAARGRRSGAAR